MLLKTNDKGNAHNENKDITIYIRSDYTKYHTYTMLIVTTSRW